MDSFLEKIKKLFLLHRRSLETSFQAKIKDGATGLYDYDLLMNLDEKYYPKYLSKVFYVRTGTKLNLKHPKSISEKIQWLKLYDNSEMKTKLTDKVLVREYVKEKIGEEYLKPVLWIGDKFDDIPFDTLPQSFMLKANHGCKWHFVIKNKYAFLSNEKVFRIIKKQMEEWLTKSFFGYSDFETQYKNIAPKIIIEELLREDVNIEPQSDLCTWCVHSTPIVPDFDYEQRHTELYKKAIELSSILSEGFKFVRVDWMTYKNKLYFGEMTFSPHSGFLEFNGETHDFYKKLTENLDLNKKEKYDGRL